MCISRADVCVGKGRVLVSAGMDGGSNGEKAGYALPRSIDGRSSSLSLYLLGSLFRRCAYSTAFQSRISRIRSSLWRYSSTLVGRAGSYSSSQFVWAGLSFGLFFFFLRPPRCGRSGPPPYLLASSSVAALSASVVRTGGCGCCCCAGAAAFPEGGALVGVPAAAAAGVALRKPPF